MAPGHVYYVGIQYIFTVRLHSQLRRNLLESDGSGASRNNLTTYPNSRPPLVPLCFRFYFYEGQKCMDLLLITYNPHSRSIYQIFSDGRQRNWRDKKLDCYMLDQRLAGNFRIIFNYVLSSSLPLASTVIFGKRDRYCISFLIK